MHEGEHRRWHGFGGPVGPESNATTEQWELLTQPAIGGLDPWRWHSEACGKIRGASLSLRRGRTCMNDMFDRLKDHPLAVGSDGKSNFLYGKANPRSVAHQHESVHRVAAPVCSQYVVEPCWF